MPGRMRFAACNVLLLLTLSSGPLLAMEFQGGEWEIAVKQTVSGMPVSREVVRYSECLTPADPIPKSFLHARHCDVLEQRERHRTVYYKISCFTENGSQINEGKVRFSDFRLSGDSRSDLGEVAGKPMVIRYNFDGRRLGECQ